ASRNAVGGKSPTTGGFGATEVGGNWGAQFKRAGFDALIVEGTSEKPVYLWVKDGEAEIRDATHLWGKTTKETQSIVRDELQDDRVELAMIGPGGENLVRYACVMNGLKDAAGRTGMGAVMGSKKLKAVVARGTTGIDGIDPDTIRELGRRAAQEVREKTRAAWASEAGTGGKELEGGIVSGNMPIRNFRDGEFPEISGLEFIMDKIGVKMEGCWGCAVRCKKVVQAEAPYKVDPDYGGPEYETIGSLGSTCGVSDIVAVSMANVLCNAYSLDTIGTGVTIAFAMECYENGLLTKEDTDGIDLRFGNSDAMIQMVDKIAKRQGLGDILAEGLLPAAAKIGQGAEIYAVHAKGQAQPMHEPRLKRGLAIGYAISPTGADHCHSLHDTGLVYPGEDGFIQNGGLREMGVLEAMDLESLGPEKVRASLYNSMASITQNCVPICSFTGWSLRDLATIVRAATGWDVSEYELLKVGERAMTLARTFNVREGFTAEDDQLCPRSYSPTTNGALSEGGIDVEELREAIQTYYGMMGWDQETGIPTTGKLHELDVGWAIKHLPA
ncbi:MAG: aldehyde ferredoxin oxidoreductase, partial [Anaerolineae bacterium]|nr:aldehyde ferredoxin oxidoreductase [Anaerolineae bacterium]